MCAYKEQYPGASQQNIPMDTFAYYGVNPSVSAVLEIFSVKKNSIYCHPRFNTNIRGEQSVELFWGLTVIELLSVLVM
jgi:hypothetical protein